MVEAAEAPTVASSPAKLKGLHRAVGSDLRYALQDYKMLGPHCMICAPNTAAAPPYWWLSCPHDPYMGSRQETVTKTEYQDRLDEDGNPTGERIVKGKVETIIEKPWPNYRAVSPGKRIAGNRGPEYKQKNFGFIFPSELRNEAFPNGIANSCEFRNCFWQEDLVTYASGTYCQEIEAIMCAEDASGKTIEIMNEELRMSQIEEMRGKLKAAR